MSFCLPTTPLYSHPTFFLYVKDIPNCFNYGGQQNTSESVKKLRRMLKYKLNSNLELDHTEFNITYLTVSHVVNAATAVFEKCCKEKNPLYKADNGWHS